MGESLNRGELIGKISRRLNSSHSREGLAQYLNLKFGLTISPADIVNKVAYLHAKLSEFSDEDLEALGKDLGIDGKLARAESARTPSEEPELKTKVPENWFGVAFWLFTDKKRAIIVIVFVLCLGATVVGLARLAGYDLFATFFPKLVKLKVEEIGDPSLQACIDSAKHKGKAYVILSLTELVNIEDDTANNRTATVRNVYTLLMLRDLKEDEQTEFFEAYTSDNDASIARWYGTERETADSHGASYDVLFNAKAGQTYTVVTGATYSFKIPLFNHRSAFGQNTSLADNEDTWGYPNVIDADIIRSITIVLWSKTTDLKPVGQAAKRLTNRTVKNADVNYHFDTRRHNTSATSLSASWNNVMPGEEVGIHFSW